MSVSQKITDLHRLQSDIMEYLRREVAPTNYLNVQSFVNKKFREYRIRHGCDNLTGVVFEVKIKKNVMHPVWYRAIQGTKVRVRQAEQADLDRCKLEDLSLHNPEDWFVETIDHGSLILKTDCEILRIL
jgi:hypothetical protein